jgi:hypothetical protein
MDKKECLYAYQYYYLHISTLLLLLIKKNLSCKPFTVLFKPRMIVVLVYKDRTRTRKKTPIKGVLNPLPNRGKNNYVLLQIFLR